VALYVIEQGIPAENVYALLGGFAAWRGADLPVASGDSP
jgi:rhodanese-related sulfurtransferase